MGEKVEEFAVSVIIPAYNSEKTIVKALDSVRKQTSSQYIKEVLVINDGSTDNTKKVVENYKKEYDTFPIQLINKDNGGVSTARNMGLSLAQGNWIALLDSDDEWVPNKIECQVAVLMRHKEIDFLGGNHTEQIIKVLGKKIDRLYRPTVKELCIKVFPQTSTVIFKKRIYDEIGGYDETRKYCEDGQFFLKICEKYNYYYMPQQVVVYDGGRRGFGVSGLSGNLKEMQAGFMKNLKELRQRNSIGLLFYIWVSAYSQLKYVRRIVICKLERK